MSSDRKQDRYRAFAHSLSDRPLEFWEPLPQHLTEVGEETGRCAAKFGCGQIGRALGELHDFGKYKPAFQCYICFPDQFSGGDKGHSTAGALYARAQEKTGRPWLAVAHAIAGWSDPREVIHPH